jgi:hypothetical protein
MPPIRRCRLVTVFVFLRSLLFGHVRYRFNGLARYKFSLSKHNISLFLYTLKLRPTFKKPSESLSWVA